MSTATHNCSSAGNIGAVDTTTLTLCAAGVPTPVLIKGLVSAGARTSEIERYFDHLYLDVGGEG